MQSKSTFLGLLAVIIVSFYNISYTNDENDNNNLNKHSMNNALLDSTDFSRVFSQYYRSDLVNSSLAMMASCTDKDGNLYLAGSATGQFGGLIKVSKINQDGELVWSIEDDRYLGVAYAIAADKNMNVIVVSKIYRNSNFYYEIFKFDESGAFLWKTICSKESTSPSDRKIGGNDHLLIDNDDNIFFLGYSDELLLFRLDGNGKEVWCKSLGPEPEDKRQFTIYPNSLLFNSNGEIIANGTLVPRDGTDQMIKTCKFNFNGDLLWQSKLEFNLYTRNVLCYLDQSNNYFIGYLVYANKGKNFNILRYDSTGSITAEKTIYNWPSISIPPQYYFCLNNDKAIYAGCLLDSTKIEIKKLELDLQQQWSKIVQPTNNAIRHFIIASDKASNVVVTSLDESFSKTYIDKYSSIGEFVCSKNITNPPILKPEIKFSTWDNFYYSLNYFIDKSNNYYFCMEFYDKCNRKFYTFALDFSLTQKWQLVCAGRPHSSDVLVTKLFDTNGNHFLISTSTNEYGLHDFLVIKCNTAGTELARARYSGGDNEDLAAKCAYIDKNGFIYLAGSTIKGSIYNDVLYKLTNNLELVFSIKKTGKKELAITNIIIDNMDDIYLLFMPTLTPGSFGNKIVKYTKEGQAIFQKVFQKKLTSAVIDDSGSVYVGGLQFLSKFSNTGELLWTDETVKYIENLKIDKFSNIVACGYDLTRDFFMKGYTIKKSSNGATAWAASYGDDKWYTIAEKIEVDAYNNYYLAGRVKTNENGLYAIYVVKYHTNGSLLWAERFRDNSLFFSDFFPIDVQNNPKDNIIYILCRDRGDPWQYYAVHRYYIIECLKNGLGMVRYFNYLDVYDAQFNISSEKELYFAYSFSGLLYLDKYTSEPSFVKNHLNTKPSEPQFINNPNPFNNTTIIKYTSDGDTHIEIDIFNLLGEKVENIVSADHARGNYQVMWSAQGCPSGTYFCQITSYNHQKHIKKRDLIKMLLLK
ncbi:MAG TPA: T9SS type A sorting domain-containing protein [bacterium]|nr:T9SS type A sorting domain-containing protein [bacterium]